MTHSQSARVSKKRARAFCSLAGASKEQNRTWRFARASPVAEGPAPSSADRASNHAHAGPKGEAISTKSIGRSTRQKKGSTSQDRSTDRSIDRPRCLHCLLYLIRTSSASSSRCRRCGTSRTAPACVGVGPVFSCVCWRKGAVFLRDRDATTAKGGSPTCAQPCGPSRSLVTRAVAPPRPARVTIFFLKGGGAARPRCPVRARRLPLPSLRRAWTTRARLGVADRHMHMPWRREKWDAKTNSPP